MSTINKATMPWHDFDCIYYREPPAIRYPTLLENAQANKREGNVRSDQMYLYRKAIKFAKKHKL
jgi:hypothetical protein